MNKNGIPGLAALFIAVLTFTAALQTPAKDGTVGQILQTEVSQMVNMAGAGLVLVMLYLGLMWDLVLKFLGIAITVGIVLLFVTGATLFAGGWVIGIFKHEPEEKVL